jgi:hypothetical protein
MTVQYLRGRIVSGVLSSVLFLAVDIQAQCSDAGACGISRHDRSRQIVQPNTLALRYSFGSSGTPDDVKYNSVIAEANLHPYSQSRLTVTLPVHWQSGPLGAVNGLGDLIAVWEQTVLEWDDQQNQMQVQAGVRLATGDANANPALPMTYQPGLGSNDVMLGASLNLSNWNAGAVYQIAGGRNDNALVRLKRGDQAVVWASYEFLVKETAFIPGLTIIKQIQESSILDTSKSSEAFVTVPGSDQLQVNLGIRVRHPLSSVLGAELFAAVPLRPREVNVDGLKRSLVLTLGLFVTL